MKSNTRVMTSGILPFIVMLPFPAAASSAPDARSANVDSISFGPAKGTIAGFPTLLTKLSVSESDRLMVAKGTIKGTNKTTKKCPVSPSEPTTGKGKKKCKK